MHRTFYLGLFCALSCVACGAPMNQSPATEPTASSNSSSSTDASASTAPAEEGPKAKADDEWAVFTYAPGVTVEMPGTPMNGGQDVFVLKRGEGRGLSVTCMDSGGKAHTAEVLLGARRGVIGDRKLLSEKKVTRGNAKGVQLDIATQTTAGTTVMHVLLLAGSVRVCNFNSIVSGPASNADTERFLGSAKVE